MRHTRRRLPAATALLVVGLTSCGSPDGAPDAGPVVTSTTTVAPDPSGTGTADAVPSAETSPPTDSASGSTDVATPPRCADDPRADGETEVLVNRGEMACAQVTSLLDEYYALARSGQYGNAGIVPDVRGFSCASPTARSAEIAGLGTRCSGGGVEVIVRPTAPAVPGVQVQTADFTPQGSQINGRSFFSLPSGQSGCGIYPDHTPPHAACYGAMPPGSPRVTNLVGGPAEANAVDLVSDGEASLVNVQERPHPVDGVPFGTLEVGQTIVSAGIACTVLTEESVTCTNRQGKGFTYSPTDVSLD